MLRLKNLLLILCYCGPALQENVMCFPDHKEKLHLKSRKQQTIGDLQAGKEICVLPAQCGIAFKYTGTKARIFPFSKSFSNQRIISPVLFRPLYGESALIKILLQTKARTISYQLSLGQSIVIIYSQAIRASASQKFITQLASARNA